MTEDRHGSCCAKLPWRNNDGRYGMFQFVFLQTGLDQRRSHAEIVFCKWKLFFSVSAQAVLLSEGKLLSGKVVGAVPSEQGTSVLHHNDNTVQSKYCYLPYESLTTNILLLLLLLLLIPCMLQSVQNHLVTFLSIALEACWRYFQWSSPFCSRSQGLVLSLVNVVQLANHQWRGQQDTVS